MAAGAGKKAFLAIDIGASSGRHVLGRFDGGRIELEEVYRFENGGVEVQGKLFWDALGQWSHLLEGMRAAANQVGADLTSVGVDTWGVDFALIGRDGGLMGNPRHYRDAHTDGVMERAFGQVSREEIFRLTGLQFLQFNTLFQLLALKEAGSPQLEAADTLLMMPDLFHWMMTGELGVERTNATTTQFYDPNQRDWSRELLARFDLRDDLLPGIVEPASELGPLSGRVADATGLSGARVVLPGTHDTASAVMAVPASTPPAMKPEWCYISSGTWSLMGVELPRPLISADCLAHNFTNEGGVGGTSRFLKNIAGLWLVQECRRVWAAEGRAYDWDDLTRMAADAAPRAAFVDPDSRDFLSPDHMPSAIREHCRRHGQTVPESEGAVIRCAMESLALRYRAVLSSLEALTGARIPRIHIVGGGSLNTQLCQWTADACQREVVAGPSEATATGNLMAQAIAAGAVGSVTEAREVIRRSLPVTVYEPADGSAWEEAAARYEKMTANND